MKLLRLLVAVLAVVLVAGSCSDSQPLPTTTTTAAPTTTAVTTTTATTTPSPAGSTTTAAAFPVNITGLNGDVTITAQPQRIISLSPTATEILFAVGAGPQVTAVDDASNFPAEAPVEAISGFTPNLEAIVAFDPDLVVVSFDPGDLVAGLEALGVPVLIQPFAVALDDSYSQIEQLGAAAGRADDAAELVTSMQGAIAEIIDELPQSASTLTFYHELDDVLYSQTSSTFIGQVYSLLGLENIADAAEDEAGFGAPQLSAEFVIEQNPDLIFLADTKCCGQTAEAVAARPGWGTLSAVANGRVIELDDDIASRWGPRIVEFLEIVAAEVADIVDIG